MKVVINGCFGGYGLSHAAVMEIAKRKGLKLYAYIDDCRGGFSGKYLPYNSTKKDAIRIHYSKKELNGENDKKVLNDNYVSPDTWPRNDPDVIAVVEKMGKKANGYCAELNVVEIPDGIEYEIEEYDGNEHIAEKHRTWR